MHRLEHRRAARMQVAGRSQTEAALQRRAKVGDDVAKQVVGDDDFELRGILDHQQGDVVFYLEIKYDSAWGMHHALVAALAGAGNAARTIVISFDPSTLDALRKLDASIMTGLLVEGANRDFVKSALDVGARQLCPRADLITRELVEQAHRSDLHVVTWTVNDTAKMGSVMHAGVGTEIVTDLPDRLRAALEDKKTTV